MAGEDGRWRRGRAAQGPLEARWSTRGCLQRALEGGVACAAPPKRPFGAGRLPGLGPARAVRCPAACRRRRTVCCVVGVRGMKPDPRLVVPACCLAGFFFFPPGPCFERGAGLAVYNEGEGHGVVTMSAPAGRCWRRLAHASESLLLSAPAASRAAAFAPAVGHRAACMQQVWGGSTGMQASMAMLPCPCDKPLQAGGQAGRQEACARRTWESVGARCSLVG